MNENFNMKTKANDSQSTGDTKSQSPNKEVQKKSRARPKAVYLWTNNDVLKFLKRHCTELYGSYHHLFTLHDITGRSLTRMTDVVLEKLGILDASHRDEILREILKLKLKADIIDLCDMQRHNCLLWHANENTEEQE